MKPPFMIGSLFALSAILVAGCARPTSVEILETKAQIHLPDGVTELAAFEEHLPDSVWIFTAAVSSGDLEKIKSTKAFFAVRDKNSPMLLAYKSILDKCAGKHPEVNPLTEPSYYLAKDEKRPYSYCLMVDGKGGRILLMVVRF